MTRLIASAHGAYTVQRNLLDKRANKIGWKIKKHREGRFYLDCEKTSNTIENLNFEQLDRELTKLEKAVALI